MRHGTLAATVATLLAVSLTDAIALPLTVGAVYEVRDISTTVRFHLIVSRGDSEARYNVTLAPKDSTRTYASKMKLDVGEKEWLELSQALAAAAKR